MDLRRFLVRRRNAETRLTVEGWVYLVVLAFISIGSILRNVNLLVLMAGLMYAPLVLHWRTCNQLLRKLRATRLLPKRIHVGQPISVPWTVTNQSHQTTAWNVTVADQIVAHTADRGGRRRSAQPTRSWRRRLIQFFAKVWRVFSEGGGWYSDGAALMTIDKVEGFRSATGVWRVCFPDRGRYRIGPATLTATSPLGLVDCRIKLGQTEDCYVAPALGKLKHGWLQRLQSARAGEDQANRRRGRDQEQFHGLRAWRTGDAKKHIHWRATARVGQPIVRQFDQNDDRDLAMVLDLWHPATGAGVDSIDRNRVETALSFAATVMSRAKLDLQGRVTIGVCGQRNDFFPGHQAKLVASVMRALAVASAAEEPATADALLSVSEVIASGTPIFVISTRDQPDQLLLRHNESSSAAETVRRERLAQVRSAVNWVRVDEEKFANLFSMK